MYEIKKYHGDRVMSLSFEDESQSFSVGVISPGEFQFGSIRKEIFTVTSGVINFWVEGNEYWSTHGKNDMFTVPEHKNFKLKVNLTSSYICFYE